jgi:hypothetical protein
MGHLATGYFRSRLGSGIGLLRDKHHPLSRIPPIDSEPARVLDCGQSHRLQVWALERNEGECC